MARFIITDYLMIAWRAFLLMLAWGALASMFGFVTIGYLASLIVTYTVTSFSDAIRGEDALKVHQRLRDEGVV